MRNHPEANQHSIDDVQITPDTGSTHHPPGQKQKTGQGWYARMSDAKKAEYLERRRLARQQKKAAVSQSDATSLPSLHRAPLSNITNSVTNALSLVAPVGIIEDQYLPKSIVGCGQRVPEGVNSGIK